MALTKYATARVLEVRHSPTKISSEELSVDHFRRLAKPKVEPISEEGYLYARVRAISSRVNKNDDGWPSEELAKSFATFDNRPIFIDHNNDDPERTRGVVVWSKLHVEDEKTSSELDPYYSSAPENHLPPTWIELMLEVDAQSFPKLAERIINGDIDSVSMGANIDKSLCSVCGNEATAPSQYCNHIQMKGATFEVESADGGKINKKAYEDCYGVNFFEISFVFDPADETALIEDMSAERMAAIQAVAALREAGAPVPDELVSQAEGLVKTANKKEAIGPDNKDLDNVERKKPGDVERTRNYEPQSEKTRAPQDVDTLRPDVSCKQCGSEMDVDSEGHFVCPDCGWEMEPEGLDNPDVELAHKIDLKQDESEEQSPTGEMETELEADKGETEIAPKNPIRQVAPISSTQSDSVTNEMKFSDVAEAFESNPLVVEAIVSYLKKNGGVEDEEELTTLLNEDERFAYAPTVFDAAEAIEVFNDKTGSDTPQPDKKVSLPNPPASHPKGQAKAERIKSDQLAPVETGLRVLTVLFDNTDPNSQMSNDKTADREVIVRSEEDGSGVKRTEEITKEFGPMGGGEEELDVNAEGEPVDETGAEAEGVPTAETTPVAEAPENGTVEETPSDSLSEEEQVPAMASTESKLMAALKLAKIASSLGVITSDEELAFAGELEQEESLEEIEARTKMLDRVKEAGLSKRRRPVVAGRMPSYSHSGTSDDLDDAPDEALFL